MKTVKLKVYIVVVYNKSDHSRVLGVYATEEAAWTFIRRAYEHGNTYHVLKKSVNGSEIKRNVSFLKRDVLILNKQEIQ